VEINSKNLTIPLHVAVYFEGDAITVEVSLGGDDEGTQTIVSLDSLLQEHLDMYKFFDGSGYDPDALADLRNLRKKVDHYIRKARSVSASASPAKKARARNRKGARRAAGA
jgi:hypothetical protein